MYVYILIQLRRAVNTRMYKIQKLNSLRQQVEMAETLGAEPLQIFHQIVFPQIHPLACRLSGVAALWLVGDFALSRIVFSQDVVLAQVVQGLINGYHLDVGMAVMNVVIFIGFILYLFFERLGRVGHYEAH